MASSTTLLKIKIKKRCGILVVGRVYRGMHYTGSHIAPGQRCHGLIHCPRDERQDHAHIEQHRHFELVVERIGDHARPSGPHRTHAGVRARNLARANGGEPLLPHPEQENECQPGLYEDRLQNAQVRWHVDDPQGQALHPARIVGAFARDEHPVCMALVHGRG